MQKCKICGNTNYLVDTKKFPKDYCSYKCYEEWSKWNKKPNCKCSICEKDMYLKPSRLKRVKNGISCSIECSSKLKSKYFTGEGNHQFGLIGDLNSSFSENVIYNKAGYLVEYCPGHPRPNDNSIKGSRVLQHRLVVERNYKKFDFKYFEEINGWIVLKQEYDVHHINEIKDDNRIENLMILTRSEHTSLHNKLLKSKNLNVTL